MRNSVSIIIPTLNEEQALPQLLNDIKQQKGVLAEIIIGDGGSSDATIAIAEQHGAIVIVGKSGRGVQMNAAASVATAGNPLLFMHADSRLFDQNLLSTAIQSWLKQPTNTAGHFSLNFYDINTTNKRKPLRYRVLEKKSASNKPFSINGDQCLLIKPSFFHRLGGFDESLPFLEDQTISLEIMQQGQWYLLPGSIGTSCRRFESEGFFTRYLLMTLMMFCWRAGLNSFFTAAPDCYQHQKNTGILKLTPFLITLQSILARQNNLEKQQIRRQWGTFLIQNFWQLALWPDMLLPKSIRSRTPLTNTYFFIEKLLSPLRNIAIFLAGYMMWRLLRYILPIITKIIKF